MVDALGRGRQGLQPHQVGRSASRCFSEGALGTECVADVSDAKLFAVVQRSRVRCIKNNKDVHVGVIALRVLLRLAICAQAWAVQAIPRVGFTRLQLAHTCRRLLQRGLFDECQGRQLADRSRGACPKAPAMSLNQDDQGCVQASKAYLLGNGGLYWLTQTVTHSHRRFHYKNCIQLNQSSISRLQLLEDSGN